jgi:Raf kinase inhibitor-like YbhB/YbcL family protein
MSLGSQATGKCLLLCLILLSLLNFSVAYSRRRLFSDSAVHKISEDDQSSAPETSLLNLNFKRKLGSFRLTSTDIKQDLELRKDQLPVGTFRNPVLTWSNAPEGTKSFAMVITDPGHPEGYFAHMILKNIPAETLTVPTNCRKACPGEAVTNSWGKKHYKAPQQLYGIHNYHFMVYAMAAARVESDNWLDFQKDLEFEALGMAEITAPYQHKTRAVEEKEEEKEAKDAAKPGEEKAAAKKLD